MSDTERMLGWHFLREYGCLNYPPHTKIEVGQTLTLPEGTELKLCSVGYHASERAINALGYAPGPIICRVELSGTILRDNDKACASSRRVIAMVDATKLLHEFACDCADDALALIGNPDPRSVAAVAAKRKWLHGEITDEELSRARGAARDAARGAAWDAAWDAAWGAARGAARGAAWDAQNNLLESMLFRAMGLERETCTHGEQQQTCGAS